MIEFPANDIGVTGHGSWSNEMDADPIEAQFQKAGVAFTTGEVPHLVGMAGCARLLFYTSPKTGLPVTVFVIPTTGGDWWAEDYYYFTGLTEEAATALGEPEWLRRYDVCRTLRDEWIRREMRKKGPWTPQPPTPGEEPR